MIAFVHWAVVLPYNGDRVHKKIYLKDLERGPHTSSDRVLNKIYIEPD